VHAPDEEGALTVALATLTGSCVAGTAGSGPPTAGSEVVVAWNDLVLAVAEAEDRFLTLKGLRTATMMHLAMHDAVNAVAPRFEPFLESPAAPRGDGWDTEAEYEWHPMAPGVYAEFSAHSGTPEGFVFGAGWARARPFLVDRADRFRSPPPPPVNGPDYARAFAEVKEVGRFASTSRTDDQTHLAMWWKEFVEKSHNRLARELAVAEGLDLWQAARLFALLDAAVYDGYVAVFADKFRYDHWRPYTAIRWAAHDGNPATDEDPTWDNTHRHTYPFPSYPSAHGTACAAAMTVLAEVFGDDRPVTMTTPEVDAAGPLLEKVPMDPPTRSFPSFSAAAEECALSRVYLGIHFRYDSVAGNRLGRQIGRYALEGYLRPAG
jgi:membrane-associated phospholipid phosphatase